MNSGRSNKREDGANNVTPSTASRHCLSLFEGQNGQVATKQMENTITVTSREQRHIVLLVINLVSVLFISFAYPSFAMDIYVSQRNGTVEDCCRQGETCLTLNLALDCLRQNNHTTVWIEPDTYYLNATGRGDEKNYADYEFRWMQDIAIVAVSEENSFSDEIPVNVVCNNVSEDRGAGLTFLNSTNVTIRGVMFDGCGVYHYSTSRSKIYSSSGFFKFFAALYFMLCTDVALEFVHINGTNGIGVVMYSTVGSNRIQYCNFSHNAVGADYDIPGGGGVYIEFAYCLPGHDGLCDNSTNVPFEKTNNARYRIYFTTFYKNNATVTNATDLTFILPHLNDHVAFGRGGGLSFFFKGSAFNNTISVSNSTFTGNSALWGAGLYVEYQDNASNNSFEVLSSTIDSNICHNSESESKGTGGGGVRVDYMFINKMYGHIMNNGMVFFDVLFVKNKAYFGGGLSFIVPREPESSNPTNYISFNQCTWQNNIARVGSAADISIWHPVASGAIVKPSFTDCKFVNNSALYTTQLGSQVGVGALYVDSVPVSFSGSVLFISNTETALAVISTGIYFEEDCHANFTDNRGRNGGAIALLGNSFLQVSRQSIMTFVNNSAELKGGAIYGQSIGEHDLISSRNCFIRYEDIEVVPQNWTAIFVFQNNTAGDGEVNSIHVTSLLTCLWGGAFGSTETIQVEADKVFCWSNHTWSYSEYCSLEISTSPAQFVYNKSVTEDNLPTYNATVIPGMRTRIDLSVNDDRDNNVTQATVLTAKLVPFDSSNSISLDKNSLYISDRTIELYGEPGSMANLRLETIEPRVISTKVQVELQPCPPGMVLGSSASCQCSGSYGGYVDCNNTAFSAKILRGTWIGNSSNVPQRDTFLVGACPYCFVDSDQYMPLPQNASMFPDFVCKEINRTGELCGRCVKENGPVVNGNFECVWCPASEAKYNWIFYLLTEFLPIAIFFLIVVFFNVSATSGPGNAFVFFAQIISSDNYSLTGKSIANVAATLRSLYSIPYDIWNLNFLHPLLPKFCLSSEITTLQFLSTGYITAFFPLLLVVIFYVFVRLYSLGFSPVVRLCRPLHHCFARFRGLWNLKRTVLHALATFLLLSYTKFTLVSFIILTPTPLLYNNGSIQGYVVYYDGTIGFFSKQHAPYVVASFIFLITFVLVPPLILMLPSLNHLLRVCLQKAFNYEANLLSYHVGSVTGQLMTAFHECYKDGTGALPENNNNKHDFRWFAAMYFIFRLIVFAVYAFTPDWFMHYTILQLISLSGLLAFTLLRPYKNDWYNKLDATIFAILSAINTLSMYNYFVAIVDKSPSVSVFVIRYILIMCPLVYMVVFVIHYLLKKYGRSAVQLLKRSWPFSKCYAGGEDEGDRQDFLEYTAETGRLGGEIDYSINIAEARSQQRSILEQLNHSAGEENQPLILQDPIAETPKQNSDNSNTSSGYGATGSTREASPDLSKSSEKDGVSSNLPFFGIEQLIRMEDPQTVQERCKR